MKNTNIEYDPVIDILEDILGEPRAHYDHKYQMSFDCPVCSYDIKELDEGDGKGNFEVNYKQEVYKCWSCGETHDTHGSIFKLIKKFGTKNQLKKYILLRPEYDEEGLKRTYETVKLPKEFISFKECSDGFKLTHHYKYAYNYLKSRNVTDEIINRYNIGFCYEGEYHDRIIIPSYNEDGQLNYFTARSYESKPKLKYKNPEAQKEIIIFNERLINWNKPVYIVEGPFDSIFVPNSIPLLGKVMSDVLFNKLYEKAVKVIVLLDGDAYDNGVKIYEKLNGGKLFTRVWIIKLDSDKDIADLAGDLTGFDPYQLD